MKKLNEVLGSLESRVASNEKTEISQVIQELFKAVKLYEKMIRPLHSHPDLDNNYSQTKRIYDELIEAKNATESALVAWQKVKSHF
jgi:hypothetical protein